tara:strand:+ start:103492 stop:104430 length:939 start_codon:yes stop_codon:yes gene_type:complete
MTTSSKTFTELLYKTDFAELALERKKQLLIEAQKAKEALEKKEAEEAELARIAALPKITEEDVTKAEEAAYAKGIIAGKEEAATTYKAEFAEHLGQMQAKLDDIPAIIKEQMALMQSSSLNFTREIIKSVIGHASENYSEEILSFMLKQALEKSPQDAKLCVQLSPSDRFYLEENGKDLIKGLSVTLKEDAELHAGDCIVSWDNSGVDGRISNIAREIDKAINAAARSIKPEDIDFEFIKADEEKEVDPEVSPRKEALSADENNSENETLATDTEKPGTAEQGNQTKIEEDILDESSEDVTRDHKKDDNDIG